MVKEDLFPSPEKEDGAEIRLKAARNHAYNFLFHARNALRKRSYWADSEGDGVLKNIRKLRGELQIAFDEWVSQPNKKNEEETTHIVGALIQDLLDFEKEFIEGANFYKDKE